MRLGLIEALNAANPAKQMLRLTTSEAVGRQLMLAAQEVKSLVRNEQMQIPARRADRAVAVKHFWPLVGFGAKTHRAAVATACNCDRFAHSTVTDFARLRG